MKKEYYNQPITKDTDWGGDESTGGIPVKLSRIQEFLHQQHEAGICLYYDQQAAYYRIFADSTNRDKWLEDPTTYADLQLAYFIAPAPYTLDVTGLRDNVYILSGTDGNTIDFEFFTSSSSGAQMKEAVEVIYTFNNSGNTQTATHIYPADTHVSFNCDKYLSAGKNVITISVKGRSTGATKIVTTNYTIVSLSISSGFEVARSIGYRATIVVPFIVVGAYDKVVEIYIDGVLVNTTNVSILETSGSRLINVPNTYQPGKHDLQIRAYTDIDTERFYSQTLYREFVIRGGEFSHCTISQDYQPRTLLVGDDAAYINAEQYTTVRIPWGYYTSDPEAKTAAVLWRLKSASGEETSITTMTTTVSEAENDKTPDDLQFMPTSFGQFSLEAVVNNTVIASYTLNVVKNTDGMEETTAGLTLKLLAMGRSNTEPENERKTWTNEGYQTVFANVAWNANNGWNGKALVLNNGATAEIDYPAFGDYPQANGCTVEVEFETFNIDDATAELVHIGGVANSNISITASGATLTSRQGTQVSTAFKNDEKVKLAFIIHPAQATKTSYPRLMFIQNNGVLERSKNYTTTDTFNSDGKIVLGNAAAKAGIKIYSIRCYNSAISTSQEFNNSIIDSSDIKAGMEANDIYDENTGMISVEKVQGKVATMLLTGDIDRLISAMDKTTVVCDCEWKNPGDPARNFTLTQATFRNHGQSTLGMPIPSIKFWSDKSGSIMRDADGNVITGGRYAFKEGAMPAKKWVLQANYMDSSCCHNGAMLRLMNDTWLKAQIDGSYKLRTPAQAYAIERYPNDMDGRIFPYTLRIGADSIACVVFWRKTEDSDYSFLGQYVFMDDKKSDYLYGERSIYNCPGDPFLFEGKKSEWQRLWDNDKVLRFEVLRNSHDLVNFYDASHFWDVREDGTWEWQQAYEEIYPDEDDLTEDELIANVNVLKDTYVGWLCSTYNNHTKFRAEAGTHLDLYKFAAYYIFCMRFGMVDNTVRNMQIKTSDGKIWWPEPWDIDIQNGLRNDGHLVFEPRIDRDSRDPDNPQTYAFAGRDSEGNSCWLWDALEAWPEWMIVIVPKVAQALYLAGLNKDNINKMYDKEYCEKWCEVIYNESGDYKYNQQYLSGKGEGYLSYLQGQRLTHRHWWVSTSMDYWDAKWCVGDYTSKVVYVRAGGTPNGAKMYFKAAVTTYFGWGLTSTAQETGVYHLKGDRFNFQVNVSGTLGINDPINLYTADSYEEIDLHEIARYINGQLDVKGCYDATTGTNLKVLNVGISLTDLAKKIIVEGEEMPLRNYAADITFAGFNNLSRLEEFDFSGYININSVELTGMTNLKKFYAYCSGITQFKPAEGCTFTELRLPNTIQSMDLTAIDWTYSNMKFYDNDLQQVTDLSFIKTLLMDNMGKSDNIRAFVEDWAASLADVEEIDEYTLSLTSVVWYGVDISTLLNIARIPSVQRTLTGYIRLKDTLTNEQMTALMDAYGNNIFTTTSNLVIDAIGGFVIGGDNHVLAGNSIQYTAKTFPVTEATKDIKWLIVDGSEGTDATGAYTFSGNAKLYTNTGLLVTTENTLPTRTITIRGMDLVSGAVNNLEVTVEARSYPTSCELSVRGGSNMQDNPNGKLMYIDVVYDPAVFNGSASEVTWSISSGDDYLKLDNSSDNIHNLNSCTLVSQKADETLQQRVINFDVLFKNGAHFTKSITIIVHTISYIMYAYESDSAQEILTQLYNAGLIADNLKMTDAEAWMITTLPATLKDNETIANFAKIRNFIYLTNIDLSGDTNLTGTLDLTLMEDLTEVNLEDTGANIQIGANNTSLTDIKLGSPTNITIPVIEGMSYDKISVQDGSGLTVISLADLGGGLFTFLAELVDDIPID